MSIKLNRKGAGLAGEDRVKENQNLEMIEQEFNSLDAVKEDSAAAKLSALEALAKADAADSLSKNVQTQLNTIVVEGDSSPQATQASVGAGGEDYGGNLKARLDAEYNRTTTQLAEKARNQIDFVDFVVGHAPFFRSRIFKKVALNKYQLLYNGDEKGVIYQFVKDTNDDFIKFDAGYTGLGNGIVASMSPTTAQLTGTWNTATGSWYTTEIGAGFEITLSGGRDLAIRVLKETRGGIWEITVDGTSKYTVSNYGTSSLAELVTFVTDLDDKPHTIKGEFQGDDPQNPPSSTPSRGYLRVFGNDPTFAGFSKTAITEKMPAADGSNKEMAFTITKGSAYEWLPDHGTGTAFAFTPPQFIIDGNAVDVDSMSINQTIPFNEFELRQHFHGRIPSISTNLCKVKTTHRLSENSVMTFNGRLTAITSMRIMGYPLMLAGLQTFVDEFVTGIRNSKVNTLADDYSYFAEEQDKIYSAAAVSSTNRNLIYAGTLSTPLITMRDGKTSKPPSQESLFLWNRTTKPKLYWQSMKEWDMAAGDSYAWGFKTIVSDIDNVYDMIK